MEALALKARAEDGKPHSIQPLPVEVCPINSVEQALDALLVTNQHLRKWHEVSRRTWEERWRPGTADLKTLLETNRSTEQAANAE